MSEIELVALRRAALVLLLVSVARWGVALRPAGTPGGGASGARQASLARLSERTRDAVDDADRRARPLESGEFIDPNTADEVELDRLPGVGPSTASAIVAARASGAIFRAPEDLEQVRGIGPSTVERMEPNLTFHGAPPGTRTSGGASTRATGRAGPARAPPSSIPIDVNRASVEVLVELPGIGPALAERIVEARRSGPFRTLDDLTRVRGIGAATVSRLRGAAVTGRIGR